MSSDSDLAHDVIQSPKILNFGSLNIDFVYRVPHFVRPGETLAARSYQKFPGGKGANQSIALARAGASVRHAGRIGADGEFLRELFVLEGVDCRYLVTGPEPTGNALIQVSDAGENSILLFGGANQAQDPAQISEVFRSMDAGDFLLLQNEISCIPEIMKAAALRSMKIVLNPAPMGKEVLTYPLELVSLFVVNEIEGSELAGVEPDSMPFEAVLKKLGAKFPQAEIVMTLGSKGSLYAAPGGQTDPVKVDAYPAEKVVDTTAAGDTFIGYLLAGMARGEKIVTAMQTASRASAITVSRPGAANSIPRVSEL